MSRIQVQTGKSWQDAVEQRGTAKSHRVNISDNCAQRVHPSYIALWLGIHDLDHKHKEPEMMQFGYNGLIGVLVLIGDIWAILNIFQSSVSNEKKLIWILAVLFLPVLGLLLWFFLGPRNGRSS